MVCKYKKLSGITGYGKGCRCNRCINAKKKQSKKDYNPDYHKQYTKANTNKKKQYIEQRRNEKREYIREIRKECFDCGWNIEPNVLEFHHIAISKDNVKLGSLLSYSSIERLKEEINKGIFLCPNCHKLRHYDKLTGIVDTTKHDLR